MKLVSIAVEGRGYGFVCNRTGHSFVTRSYRFVKKIRCWANKVYSIRSCARAGSYVLVSVRGEHSLEVGSGLEGRFTYLVYRGVVSVQSQ